MMPPEPDLPDIAHLLLPLLQRVAPDQQPLLRNPDLVEINRALFAPYGLREQLVLQARGERVGAATWRAFAGRWGDPAAAQVLSSCAALEEENAACLESIVEEGV